MSRLELAGRWSAYSAESCAKFIPYIFKAFQKPRREFPAFSIQNHAKTPGWGQWLYRSAVRGEGVVAVRDGYHLGADGDAVPLQAIGYPFAIPSRVVVAADPVGVFKILLITQTVQVCEKLAAFQRMGFMTSNSSYVSFPGLLRILSGMAILPMSCRKRPL